MTSRDRTIIIAADLLTQSDGLVLLVRKRDTAAFMQPGGKIEPGETPITRLCRELCEELSPDCAPSDFIAMGCVIASAANEPGWNVLAHLFSSIINQTVQPLTEIAEAIWIDPGATLAIELAPLTRDLILPRAHSARG